MAPARDPESLGELWQFIQGELKSMRQQIDSNDKVSAASIARIVESLRQQDTRIDLHDAVVSKFIPDIPDDVRRLQTDVQNLKDMQRNAIAGGSVLLAVGSFIWPVIRAWLKIP